MVSRVLGSEMDEFCPSCAQFLTATKFFFSAMFGAFVLYVLHRINDRQPFSLFSALRIQMDNPGRPLRIFGDMIISSAIGAGVVILMFDPQILSEAVAMGLGLTGILSAFGKDA